jgi:DNA (cytosine-5)-methyltransferase 1
MAITKSLMWLAGRYLGDGWTRLTESRAELVITCGKNEANDLREYLNQWQRIGARANHNELAWHERNTKTAFQFSTNHRGLVEWLRSQFGHGAHAKHIPSWALGMSDDLRRSLLAGYLSADSYTCTIAGSSVSDIQTVSKSLAFGTRALVESLGMTAQVHGPFKNRSDIEGRSVNARPAWKVRWRESAQRLQNVREEIHNWTRVQSVTNTDQTTTVFNLSVEEDESYSAEGVVTHNCTHHSRAKGGKPVSRKRRGLAWVVVKWARRTRPRAIMMENVAEFSEWGPLIPKTSNTGEVLTFPDSKPQLVPCPDRKGQEFRKFVSQLERLGYKVEYNEMSACDYGAPTIRKRFFLVARRDGQPIVWPQPTHGKPDSLPVRKGKLKPHRTAADIIDWSIPCPSIFDRKKPLADKTLARIAKGIQKFVIDPKDRFVLEGDSGKTASTLIQTGYGERKGQAPRVPGLHKPLGTVVAGGSKHAVVTAFLAKHYGGVVGIPATKPTGTITTVDHHSLVSCYMINLKGSDRRARPDGEPVSTICAGGTHAGVVTALLQKYTEGDYNDPITVEIEGELYLIVDIGMRMLQPNELFRAQGFDADYIFAPEVNGKPMTKRDSVRMCGNSVPPVWTQALVQANFGHESSFSRPLTAAG